MGKFLGIGLNYADHAAEAGLPVPYEPIVFMKPPMWPRAATTRWC